MIGDRSLGRHRDATTSRWESFNAFVKGVPEFASFGVVAAIGVVGGAVLYLLATGP